MRRLFVLMLFFVVASSSVLARAEPVRRVGHFGLGLGAGTYATGLSTKYFFERSMAVQGNLGWWRDPYYCIGHRCYGGGDSLALSADLLFERPSFAGNEQVNVAWALGGGVGLGLEDGFDRLGLAAAFVIGIEVNVDVVPLDIAIEYRPGIAFIPDFDIDPVNFSGHVRYYF
jgi:hypothetical protein